MSELCLMACSPHVPGLFKQELSLYKAPKEFQALMLNLGRKQDMSRLGLLHLKSPVVGDPCKPMGWFLETNKYAKLDPMITKPVMIDVQDTRADSTLFSFGIAEHCLRRRKILQDLMSGSSEAEKDGFDFSLLSNLMGLQTSVTDVNLESLVCRDDGFCLYEAEENEAQPSLIYPRDVYAQKHLLDRVGDLTNSSRIVVDPDGRVLFTGNAIQMKDILSILGEFCLSTDSVKWKNKPVLVPHFTRLDTCESPVNVLRSSLKVEAVNAVAPVKSPKKNKLKSLTKKRSSRKAEKGSDDLYRRNGLHAYERLLSLMLVKKHGKETMTSLKKSGSELSQLLTQFSAGIAGTGLAVLFSVVCKVASGRVPFCASKLFNTGFGFGLVWLSWAVNRLGDTIVYINKNSTKSELNEKELFKRVDQSVNQIFFRAATIMAVAVLRLA